MLNNRTIIGVLLLLGGVTSLWLMRLEEEPGVATKEVQHVPDSYMENFTRTDMDENGLVKGKLTAEYMRHFPDDGSTELLRPRFEIYNGGSNPWYIRAERGWGSADYELIKLYGDVHIWNNDAQGGRNVEVITEELHAWPKTKYTETDKAATIITPSSITQGIGLRTYLGSKQLELLNEVKTHYEVKAAHQ
jgi:lipopolysaccharide export system protein LptC